MGFEEWIEFWFSKVKWLMRAGTKVGHIGYVNSHPPLSEKEMSVNRSI